MLSPLAQAPVVETTIVQILKAILIFAFILQVVPLILLLERKLLGRFQSRYGPNRVGPYGTLQPVADVLKLLSKEASTPATAVPWMMAIAPVISIVTAVATLAIIPFGPQGAWGGDLGLYGIDVPIGLLYFFAFGSLAFYALCSAAGPRARSTRSSVPCARRPSSSPTRWQSACRCSAWR